MITEADEVKTKNSFDLIDASSLEGWVKADLKESLEEAKLNLNGRNLEDRVQGIARNQFDSMRLLAGIVIQFKKVADDMERTKKPTKPARTWKDVVAEVRWPLCILGSVVAVCCIFQPQIVEVLKAIVKAI